MTLLLTVTKYTSERCQNMLPDKAEVIMGCRYEAFVNSQEEGIRLFIVGVLTLENIITMIGFAVVVGLLFLLFKKDKEDENLLNTGPKPGYCINCGLLNDPMRVSCNKCGMMLKESMQEI